MAIFLSPIPHILHHRSPPTLSSLPSTLSQRLSLSRTSTSSLATDQQSEFNPIAPTNWSFEKRMEEAIDVLEIMESQRMTPDPNLFCILIKSCADEQNLEFGKIFHSKIVGTKYENDLYIMNNLITMYAKCGCLEKARELFDKMPERNAVSWTSVISMYSQMGFAGKALEMYSLMKLEAEIKPNAFTYTIALNSCAKLRNLKMGVEIHEDMVKNKCESDDFIVTALVDMYGKCGSVDSARQVFDKVEEPTVATYTAMIDGYNNNDRPDEAISLIRKVLRLGLDMKVIVRELGFTCMIRACILASAFRQGQEIHAHMIKFGYEAELRSAQTITAFLQLYEKCDKMVLARCLFNELNGKAVSVWGKMISSYVRIGMNREALELYVELVLQNVEPNSFVLSCALKACIGLGILGLKHGKEIHGRAIKCGYGLANDSLAEFYKVSKC